MLFGFLFLEELGAAFADDAHLGLEGFFVLVGSDLIGFGVASCFEVFALLGFALGKVHLIEDGLQMVDFCFLRCLIAVCYLGKTFQHFPFVGVDFLGFLGLRLLCLGFSFGSLGHRFFDGSHRLFCHGSFLCFFNHGCGFFSDGCFLCFFGYGCGLFCHGSFGFRLGGSGFFCGRGCFLY